MAQSSFSQDTRSAGISNEITMSANCEQDLRMTRVHRASNDVVRVPRPHKRATGTDLQTQNNRNYRPRTRDRVRPAPPSGALGSPQRRASSECFCVNYTCSAALPLGLSCRTSILPPHPTPRDHTRLHHSHGSDRPRHSDATVRATFNRSVTASAINPESFWPRGLEQLIKQDVCLGTAALHATSLTRGHVKSSPMRRQWNKPRSGSDAAVGSGEIHLPWQ